MPGETSESRYLYNTDAPVNSSWTIDVHVTTFKAPQFHRWIILHRKTRHWWLGNPPSPYDLVYLWTDLSVKPHPIPSILHASKGSYLSLESTLGSSSLRRIQTRRIIRGGTEIRRRHKLAVRILPCARSLLGITYIIYLSSLLIRLELRSVLLSHTLG